MTPRNILIVSILLACLVRVFFLSHPMRYDEAYTFLTFVQPGWQKVFFYPLPNNHVLHTILVKLSTSAFGGSPAAIRLPALIAGVGLVPLVFLLCRQLGLNGLLGAFGTAVFPYLIFYSVNSRGYALQCVLIVGLAVLGVRIAKAEMRRDVLLFALVASLGLLTIPSTLFGLAGIFIWVCGAMRLKGASVKRIGLSFGIPAVAYTGVITALLYLPVAWASGGFGSIVANRFVQAEDWAGFLSGTLPHARAAFEALFQSFELPWLLGFMALIVVGLFGAVRRKDWVLLSLLPAVFLGSVGVLFLFHRIPYERTWIFLIPFLLVVVDAGFSLMVSTLAERTRRLITVGACAVVVAFGIALLRPGTIANYSETGRFTEAEAVAKYLKDRIRQGDQIHAPVPADYPLYYYLWYQGTRMLDRRPEGPVTYYVVQESRPYSPSDLSDKPIARLLSLDGVTLYRSADD